MRIIFTIITALVLTTGYAAENIDTIRAKKTSDVTYKVVGGREIKLDIYENEEDAGRKRPVIVYIHGGSWIHGDKGRIGTGKDRRDLTNALTDARYKVVSIDYRLAPKDGLTFKDEQEDCRDAIKWIRRNAEKYGFDEKRITLWGASAGAHLAMTIGYERTDSTEVNSIINDYGPTDLNKLFMTWLTKPMVKMARMIMRETVELRDTMMMVFPGDFCDRYSPTRQVKTSSVPTLIMHGGKDETVPPSQAKALAKALKAKKERYKIHIFRKAHHGFPDLTDEETREHTRIVMEWLANTYNGITE